MPFFVSCLIGVPSSSCARTRAPHANGEQEALYMPRQTHNFMGGPLHCHQRLMVATPCFATTLLSGDFIDFLSMMLPAHAARFVPALRDFQEQGQIPCTSCVHLSPLRPLALSGRHRLQTLGTLLQGGGTHSGDLHLRGSLLGDLADEAQRAIVQVQRHIVPCGYLLAWTSSGRRLVLQQ